MNGSVKVLGVAVGIWAGAALAEGPAADSTPKRETTQESSYEASSAGQAPGAPADATAAPEVVQPSDTATPPSGDEQGTGGSGDANAAGAGTTTTSETTTEESQSLDSSATGGSADPNAPVTDVPANPPAAGTPGSEGSQVRTMNRATTTEYSQPGAPVATVEDKKEKKKGPNLRGVQFLLGGGVEGYTGSLASRVRPGGAYGATVAFKPTSVLGLEVGYNGAVNELRGGGGVGGADIVRNGVQGIATFGLAATAVQPYVLAGVGINRYNVRAPAGSGFRDDTSGNVPLGGGVRTYLGPVAIDARVAWNVLFANDFATAAADSTSVGGTGVTTSGGRYLGTISAGAAF